MVSCYKFVPLTIFEFAFVNLSTNHFSFIFREFYCFLSAFTKGRLQPLNDQRFEKLFFLFLKGKGYARIIAQNLFYTRQWLKSVGLPLPT